MPECPVVEISPRAARHVREGHAWAYRSDILGTPTAESGDIVWVEVAHGSGGRNHAGTALYNPKSLLTLRFIDRNRIVPDADFWRGRLKMALDLRTRFNSPDTAQRLVFSEADALPGLILDRYANVVCIQALCHATDRLLPLMCELLTDLLHPQAIIERNDTSSRRLEGLELRSGVLAGQLTEPVEILEGGIKLLVHPLTGQKTGSYLDQRENHQRAGRYARGRCLDVFTYQGGFGLHMKKGGAREVTLVDQSEGSLQVAQQNADLNGLEVKTVLANAFDFLHSQQDAGERYDMVVLDPPAFAKNRKAIEKATRGYKEINLRALRLLTPGGILVTSSCSYHMLPQAFEDVVQDAACDAGRTVQVIERQSAARDHPERLGFPESHYLKCLFLRVL